MKAPLIKMYTEEGLQDMWNEWCDVMVKICDGGDICRNELPLIKCPTLILHGNLDPVVDPEHHTYLLKHIESSQYVLVFFKRLLKLTTIFQVARIS